MKKSRGKAAMLGTNRVSSRLIEAAEAPYEHQLRRIEARNLLFEPLSGQLFRQAGIVEGMRVLDVGCGAGDVALLVSRMVGLSGNVVGIDSSRAAIGTAKRRARQIGATNVRFQCADIDQYVAQPFDAVVGRFVLLHQQDPVVTVWKMAALVKEGGLLAVQEFDFTHPLLVRPEIQLVTDTGRWISAALRDLGFDTGIGMRLHQTFLSAGLSRPSMQVAAAVECGSDGSVCDLLSETVRELFDPICSTGIATADEIGLPTLARRLRQAALETDAVIGSPLVVSAWTRVAKRPTGSLAGDR